MIVYKCDICKKIHDDELIIIQVPTNKYLYAMKNGIKLAEFKSVKLSNIEICPLLCNANSKFFRFIRNIFLTAQDANSHLQKRKNAFGLFSIAFFFLDFFLKI